MIEWGNAVRIGLMGLAVHKFRAALSMLGIIFGVASVVAVIAVSEGARGEVLKQLAAMGVNNIMVTGLDWRSGGSETRDIKKKARLGSNGLTLREAEAALAHCRLLVTYAPLRKVQASIRSGETPVSADVVGTTPAFLGVMGYRLREGRWFLPPDEKEARRVCVIEDTIRQECFKLESPLGRTLVIDHEPYEVVGVLESKEASSDQKYEVIDIKQLNRRCYIPLAATLARMTQEPLSDQVSEIIFQCRSSRDVHAAAAVLNRCFDAWHNMESWRPDDKDFKVRVAQDLVKQTEASQRIFNYVMGCSAGISLVVGGIGIMNIMLANVTERRREIGIRRAVGATQHDILRQFLFESLSICLLGGLMGCLLGVGFTWLVQYWTQWQTVLAWWSMFVALAVSLLDGVAFGTYPAWQAGKLDPIEALRYE
ncbi:MAG: ABC transporter permease [Planctomycetota bacterium]|nr:ABC transporter permease [Planctomycetota bacterium]